MKLIAIILLAAGVTISAARADECDVRASNIMREMKATFVRRSSVKIFLELPPLKELSVNCALPHPSANISWPGKMPPAEFFAAAGKAGQLTIGVPATTIVAVATACHRAALRSSDGEASIDKGALTVSCQADNLETLISMQRE